MKKLKFIYIITLFATLVSGQTKSKISHKTLLDISTVKYAEIYKYSKPIEDSTLTKIIRTLTSEQIKIFINEWNESSYQGICKFKPSYFIELHLKDGTKRVFKINESLKENREYCYNPKNKKFFKNLWKNID